MYIGALQMPMMMMMMMISYRFRDERRFRSKIAKIFYPTLPQVHNAPRVVFPWNFMTAS